ncbi:heme-binding domain-containing protein [Ignavibacterium sp.]|uniref:heme-binding domain-containing protein n=1 Tax=Ignavibacterium sp. TaxID=2651167 RepID=UPI00220E5977|nr:heme-binding domain-containing protein [Ignavibacterium sp.]BDQ04333.1 MAG: heme-binding protein [Ignavibacterium sp.]
MTSGTAVKKISLRILAALLVIFIAIQFIRPDRNISGQLFQTDISKTFNIPADVHTLIKNACYDCHSNNTNYPWYSNIQPIGWFLANDIKNGKAQINFSEFGSLSKRRQISKLRGIETQIKNDAMPLPAYRLLHKEAQLSEEQKERLINWIRNTRDSLSLNR